MGRFGLVVILLGLAACGDRSNLRLDAAPGQNRAQAEAALKSTNYCRLEPREQGKQSYTRCGVKGFEVGESWVVLDYDELGAVVRVRRMEHFRDPDLATKRWNDLVAERGRLLGAESQQARDGLAAVGEAPQGASAWKAWMSKDGQKLIGVYLVRPDDSQAPQVVEVVRWPGNRE